LKPCLEHTDRNKKKDCIINSLLTQICGKELRDMQQCTKKYGTLMKKEGKCVPEINSFMNCLENELSYLNMVRY